MVEVLDKEMIAILSVSAIVLFITGFWLVVRSTLIADRIENERSKSMAMIHLGDKVSDRVSGLVGTAVSRTEWLNGCIQYGVQPKMKKGGTEIATWNIDQAQLSLIVKKVVKVKRRRTGGPSVRIR